jgi:hypothetical protein
MSQGQEKPLTRVENDEEKDPIAKSHHSLGDTKADGVRGDSELFLPPKCRVSQYGIWSIRKQVHPPVTRKTLYYIYKVWEMAFQKGSRRHLLTLFLGTMIGGWLGGRVVCAFGDILEKVFTFLYQAIIMTILDKSIYIYLSFQ